MGSPTPWASWSAAWAKKAARSSTTRSNWPNSSKETRPTNWAGPLATRFNALFGKLARIGISLAGSAELSVRGRTSGAMQRIPVNPHTYKGEQYLVSARGHSQWVRNMRVAGAGELRVGRRVRTFTATEITDPVQQAAVLRTYPEKWGWEVNRFFQGVTAQSSDAALRAAAGDHPVFRITVSN